MSCRIIGRNIEFSIMDNIIADIKTKDILSLESSYVSTKKNKQVENYFDKCGFESTKKTKSQKGYNLILSKYFPSSIKYIKVEHEA